MLVAHHLSLQHASHQITFLLSIPSISLLSSACLNAQSLTRLYLTVTGTCLWKKIKAIRTSDCESATHTAFNSFKPARMLSDFCNPAMTTRLLPSLFHPLIPRPAAFAATRCFPQCPRDRQQQRISNARSAASLRPSNLAVDTSFQSTYPPVLCTK
jgi:hypothetical protein